ncbi:PDDEXK nuclease domain-containing protein [Thalassomonas sp. RHCl1]|uniref:PDDEXK nuclease domain-containing protein n=1 Tax=Thalassomonas sp. RHCl1 TaxID=2995320 RepID=UPI00248CB832|nr:PDDEXK nuclease domain-containing protein [Thalassomonas sp. RHCl1]
MTELRAEAVLLADIQNLITQAKQQASVAVNVALTMMYWQIGQRINQEVLQGERAAYGKQVVVTLAQQLANEFGKGFSEKQLRRIMKFAEVFPDAEIVATLWRQLSWSHFKLLISIKEPSAREFYAQMCASENWSVRTLHERIDSMLFERTALSKKPEELIKAELQQLAEQGRVTENLVLKDPYVLDFLELNDHYLEKDLEDAILRELEQFILELGAGFSFIARQKRIQLDGDDFYIDLLFYNRQLKRLVAIDLKLGKFKPHYKGQMELYLRWLDKYERQEGEQPPLGIILCAEKNQEQIELLEMDNAGIHVAEYLAVLPKREVLHQRLQQAISHAQEKYSNNKLK